MMENNEEKNINTNQYSSFVGVKFLNSNRSYYFGVRDESLSIGDKVVVETARGIEIGEISIEQTNIKKYHGTLGLKPVLRKASDVDLKVSESNKKDAVFALDICKQEAARLGLNMNLIECAYTLDKAKVVFSYLADDRVDFRELLKILATKFHTRIELRQIGSRDKAKMVGGLGMCGLQLCCSTFLNEFDGISINRAKNQLLAINIPKLSGQCGKLLCCLKFEDDAYSEARRNFPNPGIKIFLDKKEYTVGAINVISKTVRLDNEEGMITISVDDFNKQVHYKHFNNEEK